MKNSLKTMMALIGGIIGFIYILNPTAGIIEIIPDNIPFIGNLDEAGAIILILGCLRHFGFDLTGYFRNPNKQKKRPLKRSKFLSLNDSKMAGAKGLEPSAFCVTGRRYNQLNYAPACFRKKEYKGLWNLRQ